MSEPDHARPLCSSPFNTSLSARWLFWISTSRYCCPNETLHQLMNGADDSAREGNLLLRGELGCVLFGRLFLCLEGCLCCRSRLQHEPVDRIHKVSATRLRCTLLIGEDDPHFPYRLVQPDPSVLTPARRRRALRQRLDLSERQGRLLGFPLLRSEFGPGLSELSGRVPGGLLQLGEDLEETASSAGEQQQQQAQLACRTSS